MLTKSINKLPKSIVEVSITIPWQDLEPKWNEALQKVSQDVELPGFRKGQVPLQMVEQQFGSKLQEELLKTVMPQALIESMQGTSIVPIDYPKYQLMSFAKGQPLSFKAAVTERPEVKVGDYKNIKVSRPPVKVISDEDVNKIITDLFNKWKIRQPMGVQNPAVSSNQPQGATGSLPITQPAPVNTPNDSFAQSLGAQNLADLKQKIRTDLEEEAKFNNELDFEELILQEVEKITTVEVPEILIQDELNRMLVNLQKRVADMGLLLDDYLKGQNETVEGLKSKWRPQAEKNVRMELGLAEVGRLESVQISTEELQAEIDKIQDGRLKAQFEAQEPRLHLQHSLRQVKTLNFLKTFAQTT